MWKFLKLGLKVLREFATSGLEEGSQDQDSTKEIVKPDLKGRFTLSGPQEVVCTRSLGSAHITVFVQLTSAMTCTQLLMWRVMHLNLHLNRY